MSVTPDQRLKWALSSIYHEYFPYLKWTLPRFKVGIFPYLKWTLPQSRLSTSLYPKGALPLFKEGNFPLSRVGTSPYLM